MENVIQYYLHVYDSTLRIYSQKKSEYRTANYLYCGCLADMHDCAQCKPKALASMRNEMPQQEQRQCNSPVGFNNKSSLCVVHQLSLSCNNQCNPMQLIHPSARAHDPHFWDSPHSCFRHSLPSVHHWEVSILQMFWGFVGVWTVLMSYNCRIRWTVCTRSSASIHRDRVAQLASKQAG